MDATLDEHRRVAITQHLFPTIDEKLKEEGSNLKKNALRWLSNLASKHSSGALIIFKGSVENMTYLYSYRSLKTEYTAY
jgi:hypothetical protein